MHKLSKEHSSGSSRSSDATMRDFDDASYFDVDEDVDLVRDSADYLGFLKEQIAEKQACLEAIHHLIHEEDVTELLAHENFEFDMIIL